MRVSSDADNRGSERPTNPCRRLKVKNAFDLPGRFAWWKGRERHGSVALGRLSDVHC